MNKKSKFMLVWILCSIILIVSVNAQSSKNKGKTKTNQTNSKPVEFDQKEFNLEVEKLPINYLGHNPAELYRQIIDRRKLSKKGEFEKTVDFNKRIEEAERKPYFGNLNRDSLFAFFIPKIDSQYDADNEEYNIKLKASLFRDGYFVEDLGKSSLSSVMGGMKKYDTGAFGIHTVDFFGENEYFPQQSYWILIDNLPIDFEESSNDFTKTLSLTIKSNSEEAKELKKNMIGMVIFKLQKPLIKTLSNFEGSTPNKFFVGKVFEIWIFDPSTGKVLIKKKFF